ncbi:hypothetical protein [Variovorax sp. PBL-E5]|uniref:hypothetical protein n=1 Tax=Variovorax sp. PBL-E5 TaxID=434014 RepID=UPI0013193BED|nr:hypothetical protein [Variovorax sp. PBL-E5]VTU29981.1 hypothetical protein E5CHR_02921 [Variovorax sp. PBL-E5]
MNDDTETELATIEAPAFLDDPRVLAYLDKTDANMNRLAVEPDGRLFAFSKANPEALCRFPLVDMVALAFPAYAEKPKRPAVQKVEGRPLPKTGNPAPGSALDKFVRGVTGGPPMIYLPDGRREAAHKLIKLGPLTHVPVVDEGRTLLGFAEVPDAAYRQMVESDLRPDRLMWKLDDEGQITTRIHRSQIDTYTRRVQDVLGELGIEAAVSLRGLRY